MKSLIIFIVLLGITNQTQGGPTPQPMTHEMQHGFILSIDDSFASHLVATGHHSRQAEITGHLEIHDSVERDFYFERKANNSGHERYFLFQAQSIALPAIAEGQVLTGHIVEAQIGTYDPKNIIVKNATFTIGKILLNIENPFFGDQ